MRTAALSIIAALTLGCTETGPQKFEFRDMGAGTSLEKANKIGAVVNCSETSELTSSDPMDYNRLRIEGRQRRVNPDVIRCEITGDRFAGVLIESASATFTHQALTGLSAYVPEQNYERAKRNLQEVYGIPCNHGTEVKKQSQNFSYQDHNEFTNRWEERPDSVTVQRRSETVSWCFQDGRLTGRRVSTLGSGLSSFSFVADEPGDELDIDGI